MRKGELRVEVVVPPTSKRTFPMSLFWHVRCFVVDGKVSEAEGEDDRGFRRHD